MANLRRAIVLSLVLYPGLRELPAQESDPPADADATTEAPAESMESAAEADEPAAWERLIYVPYRNIRRVFENQGASVIVPYLEYIRMWERASESDGSDAADSPVPAVITAASYAAEIDGDVVRIRATFDVKVLARPWVELALDFGETVIGTMTSKPDGALLRGLEDGRASLLFAEQADHQIELELMTRVHTSPDGRRFEFRCPATGITNLTVTIPEADQTVDITPQIVSLPMDAREGETTIRASLGTTTKIAARWTPRATVKPQMDLLVGVTSNVTVTIAEGLIHTAAVLHYDVLRGETDRIQVQVPATDRILDVHSPGTGIRGWDVAQEEGRSVITIDLLAALTGSIDVEVLTERSLPDEPVQVIGTDGDGNLQGIHALGAVRESGQLTIAHAEDLTLNTLRADGLTRISPTAVPERQRQPQSLYYRFFNADVALVVTARPVEPRITVDQATRIEFLDDELRMHSNLVYVVERAGVFELQIGLPQDLTIDDVRAPGMTEFNVDEDNRLVTVSLADKRTGAVRITVIGHRDVDLASGETEQSLPIPEPQNVDRESGRIAIYAPSAIEVIADDDAVTGAWPTPQANEPPTGQLRHVASWSWNRRPVSIVVRTVRKPTRLTATAGTVIDVSQDLVHVATRVRWRIENAGIDTFRFSVPESVADTIQVRLLSDSSGTGIKQQSRGDEAVEGRVTWTVSTQQDVTGELRLEVSWDVSPEQDAGQTTAEIHVLRVEDSVDGEVTVPVVQITGEINVRKDRSLSVAADADGEDIETIDIREFELLEQEGHLGWRYHRQPVSVTLIATKHDIQEVVRTVVSRALVEVVVERDRMATFLCRYRITSSERQRLPVWLPADVELHDPLLNGRTTVLESAGDDDDSAQSLFHVNVSRPEASDQSFLLTLHFRAPISSPNDRPLSGRGGRQILRIPVIGGDEGQTVTQQLRTIVWIPDDYSIVRTPDGFVSETTTMLAGLLPMQFNRHVYDFDAARWIGAGQAGIVDFPREGHAYQYSTLNAPNLIEFEWWQMSFLTWVISGSVLISGWFLRRTSWANRLTVVIVVAFVAAMVALVSPAPVVHGCAAAAWGMLGVAGLWMVSSLFGPTGERPADLGSPGVAPAPQRGAETAPPPAAVVPPPGGFEDVERMMRRRKQ